MEEQLSTDEIAKDVGYVIKKHENLAKNTGQAIKGLLKLDEERAKEVKRLSRWNSVLFAATIVVLITLLRGM